MVTGITEPDAVADQTSDAGSTDIIRDFMESADPAARDARRLLAAANEDSSAARTTWVFFLALMAYFFIAISGVSHKDLLLNSPVLLPFLSIGIELTGFFTFAPLVFVLVHIGLLIQHVLLSQKIYRIKELSSLAGGDEKFQENLFFELHSYFFMQLNSGRIRSKFLKFFLQSMSSMSFVIMPVLVLLYFQVSFLPYHDSYITAFHRGYLTFDLVISFILLAYISSPYSSTQRQAIVTAARQAVLFFSRVCFTALALFFSYGVATLPDGYLDQIMVSVAHIKIPIQQPQRKFCVRLLSESFCTAVFGNANLEFKNDNLKRTAFTITAYLFEGAVDLAKGNSESLFSRNLVVADENLVAEHNGEANRGSANGNGTAVIKQVILSLRGQDLRYATLDRSILHDADFTSAELVGASFRGADLRRARISCARAPRVRILGGTYEQCANLRRAKFDGAWLDDADLSGANFEEADFTDAKMRRVDLTNAKAKNADFSFADLEGAILVETMLSGAKMLETNLQGAQLRFANLQFTNFLKSNLQGANLSLARAEAASFRLANLKGSQLRLTWLQGADFQGAELQGADLRNAVLQVADFRSAKLEAADLSSARLQGANFLGAEVQGVDLRRSLMWKTLPPRPQKTRKTLVDHRGVRVRPPSLQDNLAIETVFEISKRKGAKGLSKSLELRLKAFVNDKSGVWKFNPSHWTEPQMASSRTAQSYATPPVDANGKARGQFLAYLACGDKSASGYLAQGVIRRVIRSKIQIDAIEFCTTFNKLSIDSCPVRAKLPDKFRRKLRLGANCKIRNGAREQMPAKSSQTAFEKTMSEKEQRARAP